MDNAAAVAGAIAVFVLGAFGLVLALLGTAREQTKCARRCCRRVSGRYEEWTSCDAIDATHVLFKVSRGTSMFTFLAVPLAWWDGDEVAPTVRRSLTLYYGSNETHLRITRGLVEVSLAWRG